MAERNRVFRQVSAGVEHDEHVQGMGLPLLRGGEPYHERQTKLARHYSFLHDDDGSIDEPYMNGKHPLAVHHHEHGVPHFIDNDHLSHPADVKARVAAHLSRHLENHPSRRPLRVSVSDPKYDAELADDNSTYAYYSSDRLGDGIARIGVNKKLAYRPEDKPHSPDGSGVPRPPQGWHAAHGNASLLGHAMTHEYAHLRDQELHHDNGEEGQQHRAKMFHELSRHIPGASPYTGGDPGRWVRQNREHIINHVGTYASTDDHELVAELYAEHHHADNPSQAARVVGTHLDAGGRYDHEGADQQGAGAAAAGAAGQGADSRGSAGHREDRDPAEGNFRGRLMAKADAILRAAARDRDLAFHVTASWADVQRKAKRIRAEGGVTILVASHDGIGGTVQGEHGVYEALLVYRPGTRKVADWTCGCRWAAYAFDRSPEFRHFEGRKCSHALALQYEAQSKGMFGKEVHPEEARPGLTIVRYDPDAAANVYARPFAAALVASLRATAEDPAEVIGGLMRAGLEHRTAVLLWKDAGKLGPQSCKYCDAPATKVLMWAEHMAYIPVCEDHQQHAADHLAGQGDDVEAVRELPQKTAEHEEHGERRCPHCGGFIGVEAVEHHHCPHCGVPLGGEGHHHEGAKAEDAPGPKVSGVALKAHDTGRVLMLQRGLDDPDDPAAGTWEFPGGHHEDGDQTSLHAGIREWEEEVGQPFPEGGALKHTWTSPNGVYQGHLVVIPSEKDVSMKDGRVIPNPDDPKGDNHEQAAWWHPDHARKIPNLRAEVKAHTPWKEISKASLDAAKTAAAWDPISNPNPQPGHATEEPEHSNTTNPVSTGFATSMDPHDWDTATARPQTLIPSLSYDSVLHDEPEPALPTTYGDERPAEMNPEDLDPIPDNPPSANVVPDNDGDISLLQGAQVVPEFRSTGARAETEAVADIVAAFQRTAAGQALLIEPDADDDIAAAARAALVKEGLHQFDHAEQQELITEGASDGRRARNLDQLRIEGTHYELLQAALDRDEVPDDLFII